MIHLKHDNSRTTDRRFPCQAEEALAIAEICILHCSAVKITRSKARLWLVEAISAKTVRPPMASPLISLQRALKKRAGRLIVVHRKSRLQVPTAAIASGVEALDLEQFVRELLRA
jgi:hypothetical protein